MPHTLLRIATAGSVDDGKSTLVGRLLHDSKSILADSLDEIARTSAERGFGGEQPALDLALVTDGLRAEREQGITIDVAYRYFSTDKRSFILADCPGHVQYTRNTVTGASTAHAGIVLIDARYGVQEQTRRHLGVLGLLRVPYLVIAVNKMDLIDWDEQRFAAIEAQVHELAGQLGVGQTHVIPVSALQGDNVVERGANSRWYTGPTLLQLLEELPEPQQHGTARLDVQYVIRPQGALAPGLDAEEYRDFRGYAGSLTGGRLAVGDPVQVLSNGQPAASRVSGIRTPSGPVRQAEAGEAIVLLLEDEIDIARGDTVVAGQLPEPVKSLAADVCVLSPGRLAAGDRVLLKHGTRVAQARIEAIEHVLQVEDYTRIPARALELNDLGRIRLRSAAPLAATDYALSRSAGSLLLIDPRDGATLAAGIVKEEEHVPA
ncbi:GTP-binding protein [Glutamicibacter sp. MNS18]|uniref:sulfate adenylyltransferase subunit 1 n=1 Tax=Glutamicibacter sp. MNS18 TaxID=2989817 RepID=UPI002236744E|nr:GTP-binding protein [Glutamicibacter sp. MNS18]MCW4464659.1 GTP-binding protein [Glutamicibacter sp. MNS18]